MKSTSYYLKENTVNLIKAVAVVENITQGKAVDVAINAYANEKHKALAKVLEEAKKQ